MNASILHNVQCKEHRIFDRSVLPVGEGWKFEHVRAIVVVLLLARSRQHAALVGGHGGLNSFNGPPDPGGEVANAPIFVSHGGKINLDWIAEVRR